jgi:hypothetical protein
LSVIIAVIDSGSGTITATVARSNRLVKPFIGQNVSLQLINPIRFLLRNPDGSVPPITFVDLDVDKKISNHGSIAEGHWTASRVTVGTLFMCIP